VSYMASGPSGSDTSAGSRLSSFGANPSPPTFINPFRNRPNEMTSYDSCYTMVDTVIALALEQRHSHPTSHSPADHSYHPLQRSPQIVLPSAIPQHHLDPCHLNSTIPYTCFLTCVDTNLLHRHQETSILAFRSFPPHRHLNRALRLLDKPMLLPRPESIDMLPTIL